MSQNSPVNPPARLQILLRVLENHKNFFQVEEGLPLKFPFDFQDPSGRINKNRSSWKSLSASIHTCGFVVKSQRLWPIRLRHKTIALFQNKNKRPQSFPDDSGPLNSPQISLVLAQIILLKWHGNLSPNSSQQNVLVLPTAELPVPISSSSTANFPFCMLGTHIEAWGYLHGMLAFCLFSLL